MDDPHPERSSLNGWGAGDPRGRAASTREAVREDGMRKEGYTRRKRVVFLTCRVSPCYPRGVRRCLGGVRRHSQAPTRPSASKICRPVYTKSKFAGKEGEWRGDERRVSSSSCRVCVGGEGRGHRESQTASVEVTFCHVHTVFRDGIILNWAARRRTLWQSVVGGERCLRILTRLRRPIGRHLHRPARRRTHPSGVGDLTTVVVRIKGPPL
jgi:hypothetical protein